MVDADGSEQIWVSFYDLDENFEVDCHRFSLIAFSESGSTLSVGATAQLMLLILMLKSVALRNSGHSRSDIYVHYVNCKMFDSLVKSNICKDCRGPIFAGPHEKVVGEDESQQLVSETVSDNIDQESESISELGVDEDQSLPQADQPDNTTDASDSQNEL